MGANPSEQDPVQDALGKSAVEIIGFNVAGLIIRSLESGRVWGIAVDTEPSGEVINTTELMP